MRLFSALLCTVLACSSAVAQTYPVKPIRIIVPHGPGSPIDISTRGVVQYIQPALGQPIIVDDRDGADGIIGTQAFIASPSDGYTLCVTTNSILVINQFTRARLPYDPERDFTPIAMLGFIESLMVAHPSVPANSVAELIALLKAKPESLSWANYGATGPGIFVVNYFKHALGASMYQIPYKSATQGLNAVAAGDVQLTLYFAPLAAQFIKAGKIKGLAAASTRRSAYMPELPSFSEIGIDVSPRIWLGAFAPRGTPRDIVARLNEEVTRAIATGDFQEKVARRVGLESDPVAGTSPQEFEAFIKANRTTYARLAKLAGIQPE